MSPLTSPEKPTEQSLDAAIVQPAMRTRDKIFRTIGKVVDIGTDVGVLGLQASGYVVGQGIYGVTTGTWELMKGAVNRPFKRAA